jgi:uncharacterized iron-regulated protein
MKAHLIYLSLILFLLTKSPITTYAQKSNKEDITRTSSIANYQRLNREILQLFSNYQIVAISEGNHNNALANNWLKTLIAEETFADKVKNIVVEFGASKYQAIMDDFMAGKKVEDSLLRKCWRETTQLMTWDHQVYEEFFKISTQTIPLIPHGLFNA